jgi:glycosyltransferase involved in cell wall biosynthesis
MLRPSFSDCRTRSGLICFSHLRWNFVYQRPQHLLSRAAMDADVFYLEEPIFDSSKPHLVTTRIGPSIHVLVPHLPTAKSTEVAEFQQRQLLDEFLLARSFPELTFWYYTPMALGFTSHLQPDFCVYDCMDELNGFRFAPTQLMTRETELLARSDVVFTGGQSLFVAKRNRHRNVHCFPSSIDRAHFEQARQLRGGSGDPADQRAIPTPRAGFFGVIDERMDMELLRAVAKQLTDVNFVMIGPAAKIDPSELPNLPNLHWLGPKGYSELPLYLAGWDCGIMPFALNESTRFISPTKTPEYLAGGLPVVSTGIADVRRPYGDLGLVSIATTAFEFARQIEQSIPIRDDESRLKRVDEFLSGKSWDATFEDMIRIIRGGGAQSGRQREALLDRAVQA